MAGNACKISNDLSYLDESINDILKKLMTESDDLWKCLKYNTSDALDNSITDSDKIELVSQFDLENRRLILGSYNDDIIDDERTELRIFMHETIARARYDYSVIYGFELITHNSLRTLEKSKQRLNVMLAEILRVLNLEYIEKSVGRLSIDGHRVSRVHFNKSFEGYFFTMNNYSS